MLKSRRRKSNGSITREKRDGRRLLGRRQSRLFLIFCSNKYIWVLRSRRVSIQIQLQSFIDLRGRCYHEKKIA
jgi:hypothetical protein